MGTKGFRGERETDARAAVSLNNDCNKKQISDTASLSTLPLSALTEGSAEPGGP